MAFKGIFEFSGICTLIVEPKQVTVRMLDMETLGFSRHESVLVLDKTPTLAKTSHDADLVAAVPGRLAEYLVFSLRGSKPITIGRENATGLKVYDPDIVMDQPPTRQKNGAGVADPALADSLKWVADIGQIVNSRAVEPVSSVDFVFKNGTVSAQGLWEQNEDLTFDFDPAPAGWKAKRFLAARFKVVVEFNKYLDVFFGKEKSVLIDGDYAFSVSNTCTCQADQDPDFYAHYKNVRGGKASNMKPNKPSFDIPPWAPEECFVGYLDLR